MKKLFGTDGIRGVAGRFPLTSSDVHLLGRAAGHVLKEKIPGKRCRVLAVRDTRVSGESLLKHLANGLRETGVDVYDAGVLCTPSVAHLVRAHRFDSGVVLSASHNPPEFNGIKFFNNLSRKWPDAWESEVEAKFERFSKQSARKTNSKFPLGKLPAANLVDAHSLQKDYEEFLLSTVGEAADFSGLRVAIDCSNGANSETAPDIFRQLGATIFVIGAKPNGNNINVGCGSQHTEKLSKLVREKKCHVGVAFDGDGDRVIMVDEKGNVLDGDHILAILAQHMKKTRALTNNAIVITVMANLGLKKALKKMGIRAVEVAVGDRYVSEAMKKEGAALGGEQSGHIILGNYLPTGDGLLTAIHVLAYLCEKKQPISKLAAAMKKYPQHLLNVPIKERIPVDLMPGVGPLVRKIEKTLGDNGRVLIRYSGTEPLLRIMLEGPDKNQVVKFANSIADAVRQTNAKTKEPALVL